MPISTQTGIKFTRTVRVVRRAIAPAAFPPEPPQQARAAIMADIIKKRNLNPQRRNRTYPRVIKRARHNSYQVKKPGDKGIRHDKPSTIVLVNLPRAAQSASRITNWHSAHWRNQAVR